MGSIRCLTKQHLYDTIKLQEGEIMKIIQSELNQDECCTDDMSEIIARMIRVFQLFERDQIKVHGFTTSQYYCLSALVQYGPLTMNELSRKVNLKTSTMTRVVDKLVRDAYIERLRDENDRRIVTVSLTEKGKQDTMVVSDSVNQYYKRILNHLPKNKVDEVIESTNLLLDAFENANPECC